MRAPLNELQSIPASPSAHIIIATASVKYKKCKKLFSQAEENSCSSSDTAWMNREQNVQTPVMMHSPHLTSTVLRDPKKMRPEDSYTAAYTMPTEQHPHQPVATQQQPHHHHQAAMDYKYKKNFSVFSGFRKYSDYLSFHLYCVTARIWKR